MHEQSQTYQTSPGGPIINAYGPGNMTGVQEGMPLFPRYGFEQSQYPSLQQGDQAAALRSMIHGRIMPFLYPENPFEGLMAQQQQLQQQQLQQPPAMPQSMPMQQSHGGLLGLLLQLLLNPRPFNTNLP